MPDAQLGGGRESYYIAFPFGTPHLVTTRLDRKKISDAFARKLSSLHLSSHPASTSRHISLGGRTATVRPRLDPPRTPFLSGADGSESKLMRDIPKAQLRRRASPAQVERVGERNYNTVRGTPLDASG